MQHNWLMGLVSTFRWEPSRTFYCPDGGLEGITPIDLPLDRPEYLEIAIAEVAESPLAMLSDFWMHHVENMNPVIELPQRNPDQFRDLNASIGCPLPIEHDTLHRRIVIVAPSRRTTSMPDGAAHYQLVTVFFDSRLDGNAEWIQSLYGYPWTPQLMANLFG